jgi:hypothetical protein
LRAVAFPAPAGFNLRVQSNGRDNFARKFFTPVRFGIFLALLVFASFPQVLLGLETFVARDFGLFAYPLAHFQQDCLRHGVFPLWNPYNNCGVPFLAQWNTMPLYPPALFYLALPLTWSLGVFSLLHLWWAGFGMYFLARHWSKNDFAAAFAGTVFAFNGFTLNLVMWPSHIATFSWLPWVILATELAWREGWQKILVAAFVGALQMLAGGPETILLTWAIATLFWLREFGTGEIPRGALLWRFPLVVALVISLTLPQLLPFLDLVAHAQRESGFADLRWSMPGFGLANFLVPTAFGNTLTEGIFFQHGQYWTSSYYLGLAPLWLALVAFFFFPSPRIRWLAGLAISGLFFALGENTPVLPLLRKLLPQLSFITYPIKYVMLTVFAAPLLAALALANFRKIQEKILPLGLVLLALIFGVTVWTQIAPLAGDNSPLALTGGLTRAGFLVLISIILFTLTREAKSPLLRFIPLLLILVVWADVFTHEPAQNPTVSPEVYTLNLAREKLALRPPPELGGARVMLAPLTALELTHFAVSEPKINFLAKRAGLCANANLLDGVPKVDGFLSLAPQAFDNLLTTVYSVTNADWSRLEDFLGVAQISTATNPLVWQPRTTFAPLATGGQTPVFLRDDDALPFLARPDFDGRRLVVLAPADRPFVSVTNLTGVKILRSEFGINSTTVEAEAAAPSLVVIAQTFYHDWQPTIDGQPTRLLRANVAFQAVEIPPGRHRIDLRYRDRAFELGAIISGFMAFNCLVSYVAVKRRLLPPTEPDPDEEDNYL